MKDSEIKETIEAHEEAITDIHSEIEDLKDKIDRQEQALQHQRQFQKEIDAILDTHRVEIKALAGIINSVFKQVAQIESDLITGEATP